MPIEVAYLRTLVERPSLHLKAPLCQQAQTNFEHAIQYIPPAQRYLTKTLAARALLAFALYVSMSIWHVPMKMTGKRGKRVSDRVVRRRPYLNSQTVLNPRPRPLKTEAHMLAIKSRGLVDVGRAASDTQSTHLQSIHRPNPTRRVKRARSSLR
jgi:hypothetical protein